MNNSKILKKEKGVIIVMFLLFLPFMLAFVGLAIDFGYIYATKTKMQNMADAAALAGVPNLQNTTTPKVEDYVKTFLEKNGFDPVGDKPSTELDVDKQNWKMNFYRMGQDVYSKEVPIEVDKAEEGTRLRVTIAKKINLLFLPIVSADLANIKLTATAVAKGTGGIPLLKEFQIVTMKTLQLGSKNGVNVYIPSYPDNMKARADHDANHIKDQYQGFVYNKNFFCDCDKYLDRNVYAAEFVFNGNSQLRVAGQVYSDEGSSVSGGKNDTGIIFKGESGEILNISSYKSNGLNTLQKELGNVWGTGQMLIQYETNKNALVITVNNPDGKSLVSYSDWNMKDYLEQAQKQFGTDKEPIYKGLDILVPVIIINKGAATTVDLNISYFSFRKELIVVGANLSLSGKDYPYQRPSTWNLDTKNINTIYSDIYCFTNGTSSLVSTERGSFKTGGGNCAQKDFTGRIYADSGITINPVNGYKRHIFRNSILSYGNITFNDDNSTPTTNYFEVTPIEEAIILVE